MSVIQVTTNMDSGEQTVSNPDITKQSGNVSTENMGEQRNVQDNMIQKGVRIDPSSGDAQEIGGVHRYDAEDERDMHRTMTINEGFSPELASITDTNGKSVHPNDAEGHHLIVVDGIQTTVAAALAGGLIHPITGEAMDDYADSNESAENEAVPVAFNDEKIEADYAELADTIGHDQMGSLVGQVLASGKIPSDALDNLSTEHGLDRGELQTKVQSSINEYSKIVTDMLGGAEHLESFAEFGDSYGGMSEALTDLVFNRNPAKMQEAIELYANSRPVSKEKLEAAGFKTFMHNSILYVDHPQHGKMPAKHAWRNGLLK